MTRAAAVAVLLLSSARVGAQPWQAAAGHGSAGATFTTLRTTQLATPDGTDIVIPRFARQEILVSGTYGVTDRITLLVGATLLAHTSIQAFDSSGGYGDTRVGAQASLGQHGPWATALRGVVQAPTGDAGLGAGLLPTGTGAWEGDAVFSVGRPLGPRLFAFGEAGYHARGAGLRDSFVFNSQLGFIAASRVTLGWNVRGVQPFNTGPIGTTLASASGLGDGVTFVAYGPSAALRLNGGWSLLGGIDGGVHTRNLAAGAAYHVGLVYAR